MPRKRDDLIQSSKLLNRREGERGKGRVLLTRRGESPSKCSFRRITIKGRSGGAVRLILQFFFGRRRNRKEKGGKGSLSHHFQARGMGEEERRPIIFSFPSARAIERKEEERTTISLNRAGRKKDCFYLARKGREKGVSSISSCAAEKGK